VAQTPRKSSPHEMAELAKYLLTSTDWLQESAPLIPPTGETPDLRWGGRRATEGIWTWVDDASSRQGS
jgi:hypothetical protein